MKTSVKFFLILAIFFSLLYADEQNPTKDEVAKLYVATFNRAPDSAGLDYWVNDSGLTLSQIAQSFFDQPETQALYPPTTSNRDFIKSVYQNLFNRDPDAAGWDYWENQLNIGAFSKNRFIEAVINGAKDTQEFGLDATMLSNKTKVGLYFVEQNLTDTTKAKEVMSIVKSDEESVSQALNTILKIKTSSSNPSKIISSIEDIGSIKVVKSKGDKLFLGGYEGILYIVDIADKSHPKILSQLDTSDIIEDIAIDSATDRLFIANNQNGLTIVNIADLNSPSIIKSVSSGYARALAIKDSIIYVASGYKGINLFSLDTYKDLGNIPVDGDFTDTIALSSDYIYTSDAYSKNIIATSLTTKKKAFIIPKTISFSSARDDITISSKTMFVADSTAGLLIYDLSAGSSASLLSATPPSKNGISRQVTLSSDMTKAYVATSTNGIDIYDITDKSAPKLIDTIDTPGSALRSIISNDQKYLFVADHMKGLQIIELGSTVKGETTATDSTLMDISKWDIYGTASIANATFTVGDSIGYDPDDTDADKNYWNALADGSTQYDYDVIVSKDTFTPPIDLKFSGTISTSDLGYNEMGFAYKNEDFNSTIAGGLSISTHIAEFVSRWEDTNLLDLYISGKGYVNSFNENITIPVYNSYITGSFEIKWDGKEAIFYFNDKEIYRQSVSYTSGKKVVIFFKNYERNFKLTNIEAKTFDVSTATQASDIKWFSTEPDGYFSWQEADEWCKERGYRLPYMSELIQAWNDGGGQPSPEGFKKDTFYWAIDSVGTNEHKGCAMDVNCSSDDGNGIPDDGYGHPKCVMP